MAAAAPNPGGSSPGGTKACSSCGWANAPAATRCEFCKLPFERPRPAGPPPMRICPHCGAEAVRDPKVVVCPTCEQGFHEPVSVVKKAAAQTERLVKAFDITPRKVIFGVIVFMALAVFTVVSKVQNRAATADRVNKVRQMLLIYNGENGGYPENLAVMEKRFGGLPPYLQADSWDRPLRYLPSKPYSPQQGLTMSEGGGNERLFAECDLRSAGPNGTFDDGDDIYWKGTQGP